MGWFRLDFTDDTVDIGVRVNEAFGFFKQLENWPSWTKCIRRVSRKSEGDWRVGFRFVFVPDFLPVPLDTKVLEYEENRTIGWGLRTPVAAILHRFSFEPAGEGRCRVHQVEFAEGLLALLARPLQNRIATFDRQLILDFQAAVQRSCAGRG